MKYLLAFLLLIAAPLAHADQFQYNNIRDAVSAIQVLNKVKQAKLFCAPCGETQARTVEIRTTGIELVWDDMGKSSKPYRSDGVTYWEVLLNGKAVDLAYVYIPHDGKWTNLAMIVGAKPQQVPEFIK